MVLRTQFNTGYQVNYWVGNEYHLIEKDSCRDEFEKMAETYFKDTRDIFLKDTYAFVCYNKGKDVMPLFKEHYNCILSPNGELFATLTLR